MVRDRPGADRAEPLGRDHRHRCGADPRRRADPGRGDVHAGAPAAAQATPRCSSTSCGRPTSSRRPRSTTRSTCCCSPWRAGCRCSTRRWWSAPSSAASCAGGGCGCPPTPTPRRWAACGCASATACSAAVSRWHDWRRARPARPRTPITPLGDALTTAKAFIALAGHLDARSPQTVGSLQRAEARRRRRAGGSSLVA